VQQDEKLAPALLDVMQFHASDTNFRRLNILADGVPAKEQGEQG